MYLELEKAAPLRFFTQAPAQASVEYIGGKRTLWEGCVSVILHEAGCMQARMEYKS